MSTIIGKIIPTIDQQITWLRKDRTMMENGLTLLEDPKDIGTYEEEIVMLKAIEENLIAAKMREEANHPRTCTHCGRTSDKLWKDDSDPGKRLCPKCAIASVFDKKEFEKDKGEYQFKNPVQRGTGDDYPIIAGSTDEFPEPHMEPAPWPHVGDSVMVLVGRKPGTTEWVDAYVVEDDLKKLEEENHGAGTKGVVVKTYWGELVVVTDITQIQFSKKKEVSNG